MQFGLYLVDQGMITANQFVKALEAQLASRPLIGSLAIKSRKLSVKQVFSILHLQADMPKEMFGEIAVQNGFMTQDDLSGLLYNQTQQGDSMALILVELGFASANDIDDQLAEYRLTCGAGAKIESATAS